MSERQAVEKVVHLYVEGMSCRNEAALRKAFHPEAKIIGNYQGMPKWLSRDAFIDALRDKAPASQGMKAQMEIEICDVAGDTAFVKLTDELSGMRFTDYLSLLKCDGRWVIVNKLFHLHQ